MRAQAANELRDRILTGRLRPGDRLDLDRLTAEFGISRTPVREALLELSYEGLVAITPRSGMAVVGITPEDAVDNFAILAALAGKGAELATARITPTELDELRTLAAAVDDAPDVVAANRRFHRAINLAARSPRLLTHIRQAVRVVPGNYFELFPEQQERSRHEHAALLDAMDRGDGHGARAIMEAHVLTAGEALGGWLAEVARPPAASALVPLLPLQHAVEVRPELGRGEGAVLRAEREVERGEHGPLQLDVDHPLGVLDRALGQAGDAARARHRLLEHLGVGADVVDQADLGGTSGRDPLAGQRVLLGQLDAREQRPHHRARRRRQRDRARHGDRRGARSPP